MSNTKTKQLGIAASLVIVLLAFGAFASAAALITKNQFSLAPFSLADDDEGGGGDGGGGDDSNDNKDDNSNDSSSKPEKEKKSEEAKKKAERARESAKKQSERSNKSSDDSGDNSNDSEDDNEDNNDDEDTGDSNDDSIGGSEDDADEVEGDDDGDDSPMFQDRIQTLNNIVKGIAEAKKHLLEKQDEGVDVTTALARLAEAEAKLGLVGSAFDANDLEKAKILAKEIKKTTHFAEKDLHDAGQIAEELTKVEKRFGQVSQKIDSLEALGGNASAFKTQLVSLRSDFAVLRTSIAATPGALTRDTVKAFEKRVKRLKSAVESTMFALGGTDDDDLFEDHEDDADDLSEDLNDVAEIESDDDNDISKTVKRVAIEHKAAANNIKQSLQDIKDRSGLTKTVFGPDFNALDALSSEVSAINTRATALESAAAQVTDPDIKQILISQASTLRSEVLKLQAYITAENNTASLFGWITRLF